MSLGLGGRAGRVDEGETMAKKHKRNRKPGSISRRLEIAKPSKFAGNRWSRRALQKAELKGEGVR